MLMQVSALHLTTQTAGVSCGNTVLRMNNNTGVFVNSKSHRFGLIVPETLSGANY